MYLNSAGSVIVQTSSSYTPRLTISNTGAATFSGSVGIGVTPNNNSLNPSFDLKGGAGIFGYGDGNYITGNLYYDGAFKLKNTGTGSIILLDDGFSVYTTNSGSTNASVVNSLRLRLTNNGNVLIGSTSDQGSWKAQVTGNMFIRGSDATSSNSGLYLDNSSGTLLFKIRNDGAVYTGNAAVSPYNNTTATAANVVVTATDGNLARSTASSLRFKENINDWDGNGLDTILALKPKTFKYKKDYYDKSDVNFLGLIAEDVAEVSPYLADYENEDRTGQVENVRYANIVVPLIKAIQELKAQNDALQSQINELKNN